MPNSLEASHYRNLHKNLIDGVGIAHLTSDRKLDEIAIYQFHNPEFPSLQSLLSNSFFVSRSRLNFKD
jgi:hypothetical protein